MRAVLLDAMGTLVHLQPPWPLLARGLLVDHGLKVSELEAEHALRAEMAFYRSHHDEGSDRERLDALRRSCAEVLRRALPPQAAQHLSAATLLPTLLGALRFEAFADAAPALRTLREAGLRLIVASNWDVSLHEVLEHVGLRSLVDEVLTSAEAGASKPHRPIFAGALRLAGADGGQALHVGDSLECDVLGARRAGIAAVLVRRGAPAGAARAEVCAGVPVIGSLGDLGELCAGRGPSPKRDRT